MAIKKWTDSRANGSATSGSAFIQSVLGGVQDTAGGWVAEDTPYAEFVGSCVDARLEAVLGIVDALLAPLVSERSSDVVNVPRGPAGGGCGEQRVEDHDGAAVDEEADLAAKDLVRALLEVVKEVDEHGAVELDIVVGLHRVRRRGGTGNEAQHGCLVFIIIRGPKRGLPFSSLLNCFRLRLTGTRGGPHERVHQGDRCTLGPPHHLWPGRH